MSSYILDFPLRYVQQLFPDLFGHMNTKGYGRLKECPTSMLYGPYRAENPYKKLRRGSANDKLLW